MASIVNPNPFAVLAEPESDGERQRQITISNSRVQSTTDQKKRPTGKNVAAVVTPVPTPAVKEEKADAELAVLTLENCIDHIKHLITLSPQAAGLNAEALQVLPKMWY